MIANNSALTARRTMYASASDGRFPSRLLQLLYRERMDMPVFVSVEIETKFWVCLQIEVTSERLSRLKTKILAFHTVDFCSEENKGTPPLVYNALADVAQSPPHRVNVEKYLTKTAPTSEGCNNVSPKCSTIQNQRGLFPITGFQISDLNR